MRGSTVVGLFSSTFGSHFPAVVTEIKKEHGGMGSGTKYHNPFYNSLDYDGTCGRSDVLTTTVFLC